MAGSGFGKLFRVTTFGESHGPALGVVIDGVPAGIFLDEEALRRDMARRRPGQNTYTTARSEQDEPRILSGVFEGQTTGSPIAIAIFNHDARSGDYDALAGVYRPGHADFGFEAKFGVRDHRGGGRSSARETAARVAAGAVAKQVLVRAGIEVRAFAEAIGPVCVLPDALNRLPDGRLDPLVFEQAAASPLGLPDPECSRQAEAFLAKCREASDSVGGVVRCEAYGVPAGLGEPVFDKLDARLAAALFSIGAVKGVEVGDGFAAAGLMGSQNNDPFVIKDGRPVPETNHAGGILGGISTGAPIVLRAAFKPTPSISSAQHTVNSRGETIELSVRGRHDPVVVPRAIVVVEAMTALVLCDALLLSLSDRADNISRILAPRP